MILVWLHVGDFHAKPLAQLELWDINISCMRLALRQPQQNSEHAIRKQLINNMSGDVRPANRLPTYFVQAFLKLRGETAVDMSGIRLPMVFKMIRSNFKLKNVTIPDGWFPMAMFLLGAQYL